MKRVAAEARSRQTRGMQRRAAILSAATDVFLEQGYKGARLDEVIRRSGGSLATLYAEFGGKEGVFAAIIAGICDEIIASLPDLDGPSVHPPEEVLLTFARTYVGLLLAPISLALYRVVIAESARFPQLGRAVFEAGPAIASARLGA